MLPTLAKPKLWTPELLTPRIIGFTRRGEPVYEIAGAAVTAFGTPGTWTDLRGTTFTVTIASPAVFTLTSHGMVAGDKVVFQTTSALPTGLTAGTTYFVISAGLSTNAFEVSTTDGGSAVNTSGSQSGTHSVTNVEHILADINVAGTFTLHVDKVNMAAGDAMELLAYQMILTSGTRRPAYYSGAFQDAAATNDMIAISVPISNELTDAGALRFTIKQPAGTGRAYPWKVLKYA